MSKHTLGKIESVWDIFRSKNGLCEPCDKDSYFSPEDDARLVACWNACEGIADPVKLRVEYSALEKDVARLVIQREGLLEACKLAQEVLERQGITLGDLGAAIAKAEGR